METTTKPVAHVTPRKMVPTNAGGGSASSDFKVPKTPTVNKSGENEDLKESKTGGTKRNATPGFKVPKTPVNKVQKLGELARELNSLDVNKLNHDPKSRSETKSRPLIANQMMERMVKTPASRRELKFASGAKFDPKFVTGIPLIKPKKPTVVKPFKFASEERARYKNKTAITK